MWIYILFYFTVSNSLFSPADSFTRTACVWSLKCLYVAEKIFFFSNTFKALRMHTKWIAYTLGMNVLYGQNIKNNSKVRSARALVWLSQRHSYVMNGKSHTCKHFWLCPWQSEPPLKVHHKKKSTNKYCSSSSYDWDFIGCKVIPTGSYTVCVLLCLPLLCWLFTF